MSDFAIYLGWFVMGCASIVFAAAIAALALHCASWLLRSRWRRLHSTVPAIWLHEAVTHYAAIKPLPKGYEIAERPKHDFSTPTNLD